MPTPNLFLNTRCHPERSAAESKDLRFVGRTENTNGDRQMGQFDSPTEAALARIKSEGLSSSPVDGNVEKAATLGGIILEAIGFAGASCSVKFLPTLKSLPVNKDEGNLIYFGEALVDDIRRLYRLYEGLKRQFDERIDSPEFSNAVANATLHITRTNIEGRLKRLANLIANGVRENELETESLDDMMRGAVELSEADIALLKQIYDLEFIALRDSGSSDRDRLSRITDLWIARTKIAAERGGIDLAKSRGSIARLEAHAFVQLRTPGFGSGAEIVVLLDDGAKFYERLQEIAA